VTLVVATGKEVWIALEGTAEEVEAEEVEAEENREVAWKDRGVRGDGRE